MACFADINVSQGSVATYVRCGGTHLTANLPRKLPVKFFLNRFILDRIVVVRLGGHFSAHRVYILADQRCTH